MIKTDESTQLGKRYKYREVQLKLVQCMENKKIMFQYYMTTDRALQICQEAEAREENNKEMVKKRWPVVLTV